MRPVTEPFLTFEDYTLLEAKPLSLQERPAPKLIRCPYAPDHETCFSYTPLGETDLYKTLTALKTNPNARCLLVSPPPARLQRGLPIEAKHLAFWCDKYRSHAFFHLQPLRRGCKFACGDEAACLRSQQLESRELQTSITKQAQSEKDIAAAIRVSFPGLGGRQNKSIKYEILHAWTTREDPSDAKSAIRIKNLAEAFRLSGPREVHRILQKAREINPKVFRELEKYRNQRARITRGGEVRQV